MARVHAWQGACMAEDMYGRGHVWQGSMCGRGHMHVWQGGMHSGGYAWQGGMHGRRDGHCSSMDMLSKM